MGAKGEKINHILIKTKKNRESLPQNTKVKKGFKVTKCILSLKMQEVKS